MSVNSTINQSYLAEVEALSDFLGEFIAQRNGAPTLEEKALVEARAIVLFENLLELDYKLQNLKPGDYPEYENYQDFYGEYLYVMQVALAKLRRLTKLFVDHFNSQQYALTDLLGKMKRVRQKRAALGLWNNEEARFVLSEHFLNLDNLDTKYISTDSCQVDVAQGVLSLPVRDRSPLEIKSIRIGSGSNGQVGNSDEAVTTNNISPEYAINGNSNNWFEYERLDSGPLDLSLILELTKIDVVNNITLTPLNIGQAYSYSVEDIQFSSDGQTVGIRDLAGFLDEDRLTVKSAGNDSEWSLSFLPVQAKTITIKLRQTSNYLVKVASSNGASTSRRRYAVGLENIGINKIRYSSQGGINSVERNIRNGLYITIPVVNVWPPAPELFDALIEVSFDGGETWVQAENVNDGIGESVLMEGVETTMLWRLAISRDDDALANATSFLPVASGLRDVDFFMRPVSKFKSPAVFSLPTIPARSDVFVMQPRIARRGGRLKRLLVGTGTGTSSRIELPFSVVDSGLDPEQMTVYVNRVAYAYQQDDTAVAAGEWGFSDDFSELIFSSDLEDGAQVAVVFEEERMLFEQKSDGFYHQMELLFDPDKDNIDISYHPRSSTRVTRLLPRDRKVIHLGVKNIESDNFEFHADGGSSFSEVTTRADLIATPNSYMLDAVNGILWLNSELDDETVRVTFPHQSAQAVNHSDFSVVYEEESVRPWGVKIEPSAFQAKEATDTVGGSIGKRMNPITGVWEARTAKITSGSDAMTLTYDYIVKGSVRVSGDMFDADGSPEEVDFIDGKTEFLGLIPMNTETTVETEEDGTGIVTFKLAAGALWYSGFETLFGDTSVFASLEASAAAVTSAGEYHIADDGTVTVYVGVGNSLDGGISILYYYQDPEFEPQNKYSVDYRNGVFYGGSDLQSGATVAYKASSHKIAYNVGREVEKYSYDRSTNSVQVRTEGLKDINRLVKVIWAKQTSATSLRNLRDYFSPLFSLLAFRYS